MVSQVGNGYLLANLSSRNAVSTNLNGTCHIYVHWKLRASNETLKGPTCDISVKKYKAPETTALNLYTHSAVKFCMYTEPSTW